jgi:hypothetical protein
LLELAPGSSIRGLSRLIKKQRSRWFQRLPVLIAEIAHALRRSRASIVNREITNHDTRNCPAQGPFPMTELDRVCEPKGKGNGVDRRRLDDVVPNKQTKHCPNGGG